MKECEAIITTCSSCSLMFKKEYPELLKSKEAYAIASKTWNLHDFILNKMEVGEFKPDLKPVNQMVTYHMPCHMNAQKHMSRDAEALIKLSVKPGCFRFMKRHCSGMGGTFGFKIKNQFITRPNAVEVDKEIKKTGAEMVITECPTCKMGVEHTSKMPVGHPIELFRKALV